MGQKFGIKVWEAIDFYYSTWMH